MEKCLALWSNTVGKRNYAATNPDERRLDYARRAEFLMLTRLRRHSAKLQAWKEIASFLNVTARIARALKQDTQSRNRFPSIHESGLTPSPEVISRQV
jgi:hypothetical protein